MKEICLTYYIKIIIMKEYYFSNRPSRILSLFGFEPTQYNNLTSPTDEEVKLFKKMVRRYDESGDPVPKKSEIKTIHPDPDNEKVVFITDGFQTVVSNAELRANPFKKQTWIYAPFIDNYYLDENIEVVKRVFKFKPAIVPRVRLEVIIDSIKESDLIDKPDPDDDLVAWMNPNGDILLLSDEYDFWVIS